MHTRVLPDASFTPAQKLGWVGMTLVQSFLCKPQVCSDFLYIHHAETPISELL